MQLKKPLCMMNMRVSEFCYYVTKTTDMKTKQEALFCRSHGVENEAKRMEE